MNFPNQQSDKRLISLTIEDDAGLIVDQRKVISNTRIVEEFEDLSSVKHSNYNNFNKPILLIRNTVKKEMIHMTPILKID